MQLRTWLRRSPQPHSLRVRTVDDEERTIKLGDNHRHKWTAAAEAVTNARAVVVECIAADGSILRSMPLEYEGDTGEQVDEGESRRKAVDKAVKVERTELAAFAREFGAQLNTAFDRGAAAANTGQENLVNLVESLTGHLTLAITNLHNVSVSLGTAIANAGGADTSDHDPNGAAIQGLLGQVLMRQMTGGGDKPAAKPTANGVGKKP